jgi:hypothetical protein
MFNEYEASEVLEIGQAEELILGEKTEGGLDEPGLDPPTKRFFGFASYEE